MSEISVKKMNAVEKEDFDAAHSLKQREQDIVSTFPRDFVSRGVVGAAEKAEGRG